MLRRKFFGFELALGAARTDEDDLRAQRGCGLTLDCGSVAGHDDHSLDLQRPRRVGHALPVIAAGVGNHSAAAVFCRERGDLVVSTAQFERADRLLVFGLEVETAAVGFWITEFDQAGADCDVLNANLGIFDLFHSNHATNVR